MSSTKIFLAVIAALLVAAVYQLSQIGRGGGSALHLPFPQQEASAGKEDEDLEALKTLMGGFRAVGEEIAAAVREADEHCRMLISNQEAALSNRIDLIREHASKGDRFSAILEIEALGWVDVCQDTPRFKNVNQQYAERYDRIREVLERELLSEEK